MWDDVIIGKGDKGNTAIKVFDISGNHSISQNSVSFWVSRCVLGTGMTIFKNTCEGKELQSLIENETPLSEIQEWLDYIVLKNIDLKKLKTLIKNATNESFNAGKKAKASEIRDILGC